VTFGKQRPKIPKGKIIMGSAVLEKELATYEAEKKNLLSGTEGKFVLIRDGNVIGVFDSFNEAVKSGYEKFGNVPFLVKQIVAVETPVNFVSNLLAI
jgi:hypothetical protein